MPKRKQVLERAWFVGSVVIEEEQPFGPALQEPAGNCLSVGVGQVVALVFFCGRKEWACRNGMVFIVIWQGRPNGVHRTYSDSVLGFILNGVNERNPPIWYLMGRARNANVYNSHASLPFCRP